MPSVAYRPSRRTNTTPSRRRRPTPSARCAAGGVRSVRSAAPFAAADGVGAVGRRISALPLRDRDDLVRAGHPGHRPEWSQDYEWHVHAPIAAKAGIKPEIIDAIRDGRRPEGMSEDETIVYDFSIELQRNKGVSDAHLVARGGPVRQARRGRSGRDQRLLHVPGDAVERFPLRAAEGWDQTAAVPRVGSPVFSARACGIRGSASYRRRARPGWCS